MKTTKALKDKKHTTLQKTQHFIAEKHGGNCKTAQFTHQILTDLQARFTFLDLQLHLVAEAENNPSCVTIISCPCVHSCTGSLWSLASASRTAPWKLTVPDSCPRMESLLWVSMFRHTHTFTTTYSLNARCHWQSLTCVVPPVRSVQWARVPPVQPRGDGGAAVSGPDLPAGVLCVWELRGRKDEDEVSTCCDISIISKVVLIRLTFVPSQNLMHPSTPICRRYSAAIKRPFAVRYDPFTCSVEVLDQPCKIQNALSKMREDLRTLHSALEKLCSS